MANAATACPLCSSPHELRTARNKRGTPYVSCPVWQSTVFFKTDAGRQWLDQNNGGYTARENPVYSPDQPRQIVETIGVGENEGEWDDAEPHPLALLCSECGTPIRVRGMTSCNTCGTPIQWE